MKANELRELSLDELAQKLRDLKEEHLSLRTERALGRLGQPHRFRILKRDIARVMTILREKSKRSPLK